MNTDKTLADVQPGGRVRLGDAIPRPLEDLRDATRHVIDCADGGDDYGCGRPMIDALTTLGIMKKTGRGLWSVNARAAQAVVDALSAQPSPGGQGRDPGRIAVEFIAAASFDVPDGYVVEEHFPGIWHYTHTNAGEKMASCASWNNKAHATIAAWQAALAARQPVYVQGSDELRARTEGERAAYMEGLEEGKKIAARQPVGEPVTVEAVATVRRNSDGGRYIDWLTEGGIADLEAGDVLMVSDRAITDEDGSGEVYSVPSAQAVAGHQPEVK